MPQANFPYFTSRFRLWCMGLTEKAWFDFIILVFIASNCITLAMERPNIPPWSLERKILDILNNVFTVVFTIEMALKVNTFKTISIWGRVIKIHSMLFCNEFLSFFDSSVKWNWYFGLIENVQKISNAQWFFHFEPIKPGKSGRRNSNAV